MKTTFSSTPPTASLPSCLITTKMQLKRKFKQEKSNFFEYMIILFVQHQSGIAIGFVICRKSSWFFFKTTECLSLRPLCQLKIIYFRKNSRWCSIDLVPSIKTAEKPKRPTFKLSFFFRLLGFVTKASCIFLVINWVDSFLFLVDFENFWLFTGIKTVFVCRIGNLMDWKRSRLE